MDRQGDNKGFSITLDDFKAQSKSYNVVPIFKEIMADMDTPVSAFAKIEDLETPGDSFLLESVEGGEKWGRYSFLGVKPRYVVKAFANDIEINDVIENKNILKENGNATKIFEDFLKGFNIMPLEEFKRFNGGAVGYINYEAVRYFEKLPQSCVKDIDIPDIYFLVTDSFLVFDRVDRKIKVSVNAFIEEGKDIEKIYEDAKNKINQLVEKLSSSKTLTKPEKVENLPITSNFKKEEFIKAIEATKEYIKSGDVFQCVISQRFETPLNVDPFTIYRALRVVNPSPYMFFIRLGDITLIGSSPEILVRLEDNKVSVRPLAGTRKRGKTKEEDQALEEELLLDPKERAEHVMLVDLGRNDVGRVCKKGTVKVDEFMVVERYSHVMHIVSNVVGEKNDDADMFSVLGAAFPAGTLTGAPKIRAMEIIEELEKEKRAVYGGSIGYFSFSGTMDMCIAIRTMLVKDDKIYIQAGAGVVADSVPELEYEETENKARGVLKALELARRGLEE